MNTTSIKTLQILNWIFFSGMIFVNFLANYLPINHKTTGQLSKQYPNLFVPAPITFSIWGIIYFLLLTFCIRQSKGLFSKISDEITDKTVRLIGFKFIITCMLNAAWIFVWHYEYLGTSVLIMLLFLAQLIDINIRLKNIISYLSKPSLFAIKSSFGMYLGWICVATIANITALLVNNQWNKIGQTEVFWTCLMITIAATIVSYTLLKVKNFYVGLAVIWALLGIIYARINATVCERFIIWTALLGIGLVLIITIIEIRRLMFGKDKILTTRGGRLM
jgi:hypothetical protein